jgi:hypothetical protein
MYSYKLTEEISRWAFEVLLFEGNQWVVAFSNPTAGPWKTIKSSDNNSIFGEVYRFDLEEKRPDLLIINDSLEIIIIIEAKDSVAKLTSSDQPKKSIEVAEDLTIKLKNIKNHQFWLHRYKYKFISGILWGIEDEKLTQSELNSLFEVHFKELDKCNNVDKNLIIGIETSKSGEVLNCNFYGHVKHKNSSDTKLLNKIISSFK